MKKVLLVFGIMSLFLVGCADITKDLTTKDESGQTENTQIANPASVNCGDVGGKSVQADITIDGEKFGQYGECEFEDNMICEEWALFNGDCPMGGVKVTGYASSAGRFCAITGGIYMETDMSGETFEQGTCTGKEGKECEAWDYYRGKCSIN